MLYQLGAISALDISGVGVNGWLLPISFPFDIGRGSHEYSTHQQAYSVVSWHRSRGRGISESRIGHGGQFSDTVALHYQEDSDFVKLGSDRPDTVFDPAGVIAVAMRHPLLP